MFFLVFHGKPRWHATPEASSAAHQDDPHHDAHSHGHGGEPHESPWVVWLPLVLLAIPSVGVGFVAIGPMLHGDWFGSAIVVNTQAHPAMAELSKHFHGPVAMALHGMTTLPFFLAVAGVALAWFLYLKRTDLPARVASALKPVVCLLENKYFFDSFNERFFAAGSRALGIGLWKGGDQAVIDGVLVDGSARMVGRVARVLRFLQSGQLYFYAFAMITGLLLLLIKFNRF
jgi:NADH-quinone oxidoreductase subunit L